MKLKASDPTVHYLGPDSAPFKCSNCRYFDRNNAPCQKVSDPIQSEGCCNLFEKQTKRTVLSAK